MVKLNHWKIFRRHTCSIRRVAGDEKAGRVKNWTIATSYLASPLPGRVRLSAGKNVSIQSYFGPPTHRRLPFSLLHSCLNIFSSSPHLLHRISFRYSISTYTRFRKLVNCRYVLGSSSLPPFAYNARNHNTHLTIHKQPTHQKHHNAIRSRTPRPCGFCVSCLRL